MKLANEMTNEELIDGIDGVMQIIGPYLGKGVIDRQAAHARAWLSELQLHIYLSEQELSVAKDKIKELEDRDEKAQAELARLNVENSEMKEAGESFYQCAVNPDKDPMQVETDLMDAIEFWEDLRNKG